MPYRNIFTGIGGTTGLILILFILAFILWGFFSKVPDRKHRNPRGKLIWFIYQKYGKGGISPGPRVATVTGTASRDQALWLFCKENEIPQSKRREYVAREGD